MHVHIIHRWEFFFKQVLAGLTAHGRRPQQVVFPFLVIVHKKKRGNCKDSSLNTKQRCIFTYSCFLFFLLDRTVFFGLAFDRWIDSVGFHGEPSYVF